MKSPIDLESYFERIGYEGNAAPTLETLKALHQKHPAAIPFENLNPYLGLPVKLDPEPLQQKLIHGNRGGFCYEQNLLFQQVLREIGYEVMGLTARIRWNKADDEITPRSHMLLMVEVENQIYIADVGFGVSTLTAPLLLETGTVQPTPHEPYRLLKDGSGFVLQSLVREEWKALYQFEIQENYLPDYKISSWYLTHHPESHFVNGLVAARAIPGRRYALRNNNLSIHHTEGGTVKRQLKTVNELRKVLSHNFLLTIPEAEGVDRKLRQIVNPD